MRRLLTLAIVAVMCLAAAPKGKTIIVEGREVRLAKRLGNTLKPPIEVKISDVYEGTIVGSEAVCGALRGYMISHLLGKNYEITVTFEHVANLPPQEQTSRHGSYQRLFVRVEPEKRIPWTLLVPGGINEKGSRLIVNTSFREMGDLE